MLRTPHIAKAIFAMFALLALSACQPSAPDPTEVCSQGNNGEDPVIIVAGTFSPEIYNQAFLGNRLALDDFSYCIFELKGDPSFGDIPGTASVATSSASLGVFVDEVKQWSGSAKVDLVGHSQGALVARHYVKLGGGTAHVDDLVSLGGPNHGADVTKLIALFADQVLVPFGLECADVAPCAEMNESSALLNELNSGDPTPGAVDYYGFVSIFDGVVWTVADGAETGFLDGGATNMKVQDECFGRLVGHVGLGLDEVVYEMTRDAVTGQSVDVPLLKCALPTFPL